MDQGKGLEKLQQEGLEEDLSPASTSNDLYVTDDHTVGLPQIHIQQPRCQREGCNRVNRGTGFCKRHGGRRLCSMFGCEKGDIGNGFCGRHGGGKRCQYEYIQTEGQAGHHLEGSTHPQDEGLQPPMATHVNQELVRHHTVQVESPGGDSFEENAFPDSRNELGSGTSHPNHFPQLDASESQGDEMHTDKNQHVEPSGSQQLTVEPMGGQNHSSIIHVGHISQMEGRPRKGSAERAVSFAGQSHFEETSSNETAVESGDTKSQQATEVMLEGYGRETDSNAQLGALDDKFERQSSPAHIQFADKTESHHQFTDKTESHPQFTDKTDSHHQFTDKTDSHHQFTDRTESHHQYTDRTESQYPDKTESLNQYAVREEVDTIIRCNKLDIGGGFCAQHGGGKRCIVEHCDRIAKRDSLCVHHGAGKRCRMAGCLRYARGNKGSNGYCVSHGGGAQCSIPGCEKTARCRQSTCQFHSTARCEEPGCHLPAKRRRRCGAHGGQPQCSVEGCAKASRGYGLCIQHGGGARCVVEGCGKLRRKQGMCAAHFRKSTLS